METWLRRSLVIFGSELFLLVVLLTLFAVFGKHLTLMHFFVAALGATPVFVFSSYKTFPTPVEENDGEQD